MSERRDVFNREWTRIETRPQTRKTTANGREPQMNDPQITQITQITFQGRGDQLAKDTAIGDWLASVSRVILAETEICVICVICGSI
jgi:hypothetical protein